MKRRDLGAISLLLAGVALVAVPAAEDRLAPPCQAVRSVAVEPRSENPTQRYLELQRQAIAQPRGERLDGQQPLMPVAAAPNR